MLTCIFVLTPYTGIYSYMIGLAGSNLITAVLNLNLLRKMCPKVAYIKYTLMCAAISIFGSVFGLLLRGLTDDLAPILNIFVCGAAVAAFTVTALLTLGLADLQPLKRLIFKKKS